MAARIRRDLDNVEMNERLTKNPKMSTSEFGHLSHLSQVESLKGA